MGQSQCSAVQQQRRCSALSFTVSLHVAKCVRKVKHGRHVENLENEKLIEALMHRPAWLATRGQRARSRVDEEEEQEQWPGIGIHFFIKCHASG